MCNVHFKIGASFLKHLFLDFNTVTALNLKKENGSRVDNDLM